MSSVVYVIFLTLLISLTPRAQTQLTRNAGASLDGEIEPSPGPGLMVVLAGEDGRNYRADIDARGGFQLSGLPIGFYQLKVTTLYGDVIHQSYVSLDAAFNHCSVRLPQQTSERPASGTVSVGMLRHKVLSKARREFNAGIKMAGKNDPAAAIEHLRRATEIDPGFMEAHNDLGVQYLKAGEYELAMAQFQKAADLDPGAKMPQANLAATLVILERPGEAEAAARKALRLDGNCAVARYLLGLALLRQQKNVPEALDHLQRASDAVPRAHLAIAEVMERRGDIERVRSELQAYLKSGKPADREIVQTWLARLRNPEE